MSEVHNHPKKDKRRGNPGPATAGKGGSSGHSKPKKDAMLSFALAIREDYTVELLRDFHGAILHGKDPRIEVDEDGEKFITWDESGGIAPTLEQKVRSVQFLADRAYGMPVQQILLEGEIRAHIETGPSLNLGALGPQVFSGIHNLLRGPQQALPVPGPGVIDAQSVDVTDEGSKVLAEVIPATTAPEPREDEHPEDPADTTPDEDADSEDQETASAEQGDDSDADDESVDW